MQRVLYEVRISILNNIHVKDLRFPKRYINIAIFWNRAPFSQYVNGNFGVTYHLHLQGRKSAKQETGV
jgi:hypothetical protein